MCFFFKCKFDQCSTISVSTQVILKRTYIITFSSPPLNILCNKQALIIITSPIRLTSTVYTYIRMVYNCMFVSYTIIYYRLHDVLCIYGIYGYAKFFSIIIIIVISTDVDGSGAQKQQHRKP